MRPRGGRESGTRGFAPVTSLRFIGIALSGGEARMADAAGDGNDTRRENPERACGGGSREARSELAHAPCDPLHAPHDPPHAPLLLGSPPGGDGAQSPHC